MLLAGDNFSRTVQLGTSLSQGPRDLGGFPWLFILSSLGMHYLNELFNRTEAMF